MPLIEGDVAYSQDLGTGWVVYIHRDDFLAGFTSDAYTVNLSAGDGADLGVGLSVGYTVVKN